MNEPRDHLAANSHRPAIAITMGDPAGVGPELCGRLLATPEILAACRPVVFGDSAVLERVTTKLGISFSASRISTDQDWGLLEDAAVVDVQSIDLDSLEPGQVTKQTGQVSFAYIEAAIEAAIAGNVQGVTTCPINKQAWNLAGITFPGHTELFAERFQSDRFCMMMTSPQFSCSLVTTHVGYGEVPKLLVPERIVEVIELTHHALEKILGRTPRLAALGLNPHAGENGLFGEGEEARIEAAIDQAKKLGIQIEGPLPPDTAFLPWRREQTDGFICMYHDQGLIPFKAFNFDTGVNVTLGLSSVRTSVDHGTALDIAWQGTADVSSLIAATRLASSLASNRTA
ncbi:MAG: 4-hydroxythreonine-4-phosphate dehydrogenase PdxA [Planctomycetota bacterium]